MGMNNWVKYLGVVSAFAGIGTRIIAWLKTAQAEGSPGGDDIVPEEIPALEGVINDSINIGLQTAEVPISAQVKLIYIGD